MKRQKITIIVPDPMQTSAGEITQLLNDFTNGDRAAKDKLFTLVYAELRRLAHRQMMRQPPGHTLEPTAIVNEAYLRLVKPKDGWHDREHFFCVASQVMRNFLVDYARRRSAGKRPPSTQRVDWDEPLLFCEENDWKIIAIDEALRRLEERHPRRAQVVEHLFFAGQTIEETAAAVGISPTQVKRDWQFARAWLHRELSK